MPLNKFRERLFERYDTHYLRGNSTDYQRYMPDYEACYGRVVPELPKGSRLLDLGCGIGFLLFWLGWNNSLAYAFHSARVTLKTSERSNASR